MSHTYTKLFSSITESTVWCEPDRTRLVWICMLAMADRLGRVFGSIPGIANRARVPVEDARIAITTFLAPDPDSRTPDNEGRRIERIEGGWRLLNHEKYRSIRDEESVLESKRKYINKRRATERRDAEQCRDDVSTVDPGISKQKQKHTLDGADACPDTLPRDSGDSEPDGSAEASPSSPPLSGKERIWLLGIALLGEKARPFIGKLVATYGEDVVAEAMSAANREQPGEPKSWLSAACDARTKARCATPQWAIPEGEGKGMDAMNGLTNPRPQWALDAGFADIWTAESAGCGPGNVRKFKDGKKATA